MTFCTSTTDFDTSAIKKIGYFPDTLAPTSLVWNKVPNTLYVWKFPYDRVKQSNIYQEDVHPRQY